MAADPIPLDVVYDREKEFLRQLREMVRDEIRKEVGPIVSETKEARKVVAALVERVNNMALVVSAMNGDVARAMNYVTTRVVNDHRLEEKLDRFIELVTPHIDPTPTPPKGTPK